MANYMKYILRQTKTFHETDSTILDLKQQSLILQSKHISSSNFYKQTTGFGKWILVSQMRAPLADCSEPAGKLWQLCKVLYVF